MTEISERERERERERPSKNNASKENDAFSKQLTMKRETWKCRF